ncbi:MAG: ABC transporter permease [Bacteroidetes bacterium]|nr:ABC transporter permease [Bacteroidota bacterium]
MRLQSYTLLIARRYLAPSRRNRFVSFITAIAVLGVMFGVSALLISLAILDGFDDTLRSNMVTFLGHIEVTAFSGRALKGYEQMVSSLPKKVPNVKAVSPYASREAIIRSRAALEGVLLKGIVPTRDVSSIRDKLVAGSFALAEPRAGELPALVIGERLAQKLRLHIGDTLVIFSPNGLPTPENPPSIEQFVLRGIYRTGMAQFDDIYTYTSLGVTQRMFEYTPDQVTGYDIVVRDPTTIEPTARMLDTAMGFPHYPRTVFDIYQSIFAWLDLQRAPIPIVLGLIIIVAVFNIASTLLMVVLEKTESIGVLSTLGARPGGIMRIFIGQGVLIGAVGTALGVVLSLGFTLVQMYLKPLHLDPLIYFIDAVPVALKPWHYALVVSLSLSLCVLFTVIPALIASMVRPVKALRFS